MTERLASLYDFLDSASHAAHITNAPTMLDGDVATEWCKIVADGRLDVLQRRIAWHTALTPVQERPFSGPQLPPSIALALPQELIATEGTVDVGEGDDTIPDIPFAHLLYPLLHVARQRLKVRLSARHHEYAWNGIMSTTARASYERYLLSQLSDLASDALFTEFNASRPFGYGVISSLLREEGAAPTHHYNHFVALHWADGLGALFNSYTALGDLCESVICDWVDQFIVFIERFIADHDAIYSLHSCEWAPGLRSLLAIADIKAGLSDRHNHGATVWRVLLTDGGELVYKPRSVGMEAALANIAKWIGERDARLLLKTPWTIQRDEYGWCEYVPHTPCDTEQDVGEFYRRSGRVLCLLHVLRATDCHFENFVACGSDLVPVDAETLATPIVGERSQPLPFYDGMEHRRRFALSVARTGFLPRWTVRGPHGDVFDVSVLGANEVSNSRQMRAWRHLNRDWMAPVTIPQRALLTHRPVLDGNEIGPSRFIAEIGAGFEEMYNFIIQHREDFVGPSGPLAAMRHSRLRFVFRSTHIYSAVLAQSISPGALRSGINRDIRIDALARAFLTFDEPPPAWPLLAIEAHALRRLDIPRFEVSATEEDFNASEEVIIPGFFGRSGLQHILDYVAQMGARDLEYQRRVVIGSLVASEIAGGATPILPQPSPPNLRRAVPARRRNHATDILIDRAKEIGVSLLTEIAPHWKEDGWMGLEFVRGGSDLQYQPVGHGLYSGALGIGYFLAKLGEAVADDDMHASAFDIGQLTCHAITTTPTKELAHLFGELGPGLDSGLGSCIYGLTLLDEVYPNNGLLENAIRLCEVADPAYVAGCRELDVLSGLSGLGIALLKLFERTGNADVLARARHCCDAIIDQWSVITGTEDAQVKEHGHSLTGLAHGAAGIASVFVRAHHFTAQPEYLEAANSGWSYERSVFDTERGNWPDLRGGRRAFSSAWCNGASGAGCARLAALRYTDDATLENEVNFAIRAARRVDQRLDHSLCCGATGRLLFLNEASKIPGHEGLRNFVLNAAIRTTRQSESLSSYATLGVPGAYRFNPSLFQGIAGVGYGLLALATNTPCALVFP